MQFQNWVDCSYPDCYFFDVDGAVAAVTAIIENW